MEETKTEAAHPAVYCAHCGHAHSKAPEFYCVNCTRDFKPARIIPGVLDSTCKYCGTLHLAPVPEYCYNCHDMLGEADKMERTPQEIASLKRNWEGDPCWDLYDTQGFARYRDELKAHQEAKELEWRQQAIAQEKAEMARLGLAWPTHVPLFNMFKSLERRIQKLEEKAESQGEEIYKLNRRR